MPSEKEVIEMVAENIYWLATPPHEKPWMLLLKSEKVPWIRAAVYILNLEKDGKKVIGIISDDQSYPSLFTHEGKYKLLPDYVREMDAENFRRLEPTGRE